MMFMPEEPGDEPLEKEKYLLANAKKTLLMTAGLAVQKYGQKLDKEQELLLKTADIINEIYVMESIIVRTQKAITKNGADKNSQKLGMTQVYCQEAFERIGSWAKEILVAVEEGDDLRMLLSTLKKLTRYTPDNLIPKKRDIAKTVLQEEQYVV